MKEKKLPHLAYRYIYSRVPRLCVDLVAQINGGIILGKRDIDPYRGMWHLPGGRVLHGESLEEAVVRKAREEIGAEIKDIKQLGIMEILQDGEYTHSVSVIHSAALTSGFENASSQSSKLEVFYSIPQEMQPDQEYFLKQHLEVFGRKRNMVKKIFGVN